MKKILSNVPTNKENAKNDEEIAAPFSENLDSSSIKESQESATTAKVIKKESDTEESVAEKVEWVHYTTTNGINSGNKGQPQQYDSSRRNSIKEDRPQALSFNDFDNNSTSRVNHHSVGKEEVAKNYLPQQQRQPLSLEPLDPEDVVREWERLHNNIHLPENLRDVAKKVAAIHIDEESGTTVQDIMTLIGLRTIDAAERRRDRAVDMDLLAPHPTLKDGKKRCIFYPTISMSQMKN